MLQKQKLLYGVIAVLAVAVAVVGVASWSNNDSSMNSMMGMSDKQRREMMRDYMGTADERGVAQKTAADRQPLAASEENGFKVFKLNAQPIRWQYKNGKTIMAWGYNGQVPGPEIRVRQGDKVRVVFTNNLPKATSLHWHGLDVPNNMDGVPGLTQNAIQPGQTFTYEFTAVPAGTRFYHTHGSGQDDEAEQMDMGLSGAFIVEPADYQKPDKEFTVLLDDWQSMGGNMNTAMMGGMGMSAMGSMNYGLFTLNGLAFPDTESLNVQQGNKVRVRFINASSSTTHPMHLHGHQAKVVAIDGNELAASQQYLRNTITLNPGETYDIEFTANNPGNWLLHCHELHHAGSGMATILKYEGYRAPAGLTPAGGNDQNEDEEMDGMGMGDMGNMRH